MQTEGPRLDAARRGDVHFLHPSPCRVCGSHDRYVTSNQCVACTKDRAKRRDQEIRDLLREARAKDGQ